MWWFHHGWRYCWICVSCYSRFSLANHGLDRSVAAGRTMTHTFWGLVAVVFKHFKCSIPLLKSWIMTILAGNHKIMANLQNHGETIGILILCSSDCPRFATATLWQTTRFSGWNGTLKAMLSQEMRSEEGLTRVYRCPTSKGRNNHPTTHRNIMI